MSALPEVAVTVRDAPARRRFEILVDGEVAGFTRYQPEGDAVAFTHTEVLDAYAGQGLASRLVGAALAQMTVRGAAVLPYCPFVKTYLRRHPELVGLVPEDRRAGFGL